MRDLQHFINGQAVAGTSGRYGDIFNPNTGEVENLEVLFFSTRLLRSHLFTLPIAADLRLAAQS